MTIKNITAFFGLWKVVELRIFLRPFSKNAIFNEDLTPAIEVTGEILVVTSWT